MRESETRRRRYPLQLFNRPLPVHAQQLSPPKSNGILDICIIVSVCIHYQSDAHCRARQLARDWTRWLAAVEAEQGDAILCPSNDNRACDERAE